MENILNIGFSNDVFFVIKSTSNKSNNKNLKKQMRLHQTVKYLQSKGSNQQNEKATNGRVENICKPYIQKGQISRIYKKQVISKSKTEFLKSGQRPG